MAENFAINNNIKLKNLGEKVNASVLEYEGKILI